MRENWDYVMMPEYARDMAEQSSRTAEIIHAIKAEKKQAERALIAAVLASGGQIVVAARDLADADRASLRIERRISDDTLILTARR